MILKTGIDLIEIERIRSALERHGERFLKRVFTPAEIAECRGRADSLSVRFAAKEAATKTLGTGIGPVGWLEVETLHRPSGEPYLVLHGRAEKIAQRLGLTTWAVSLSHSKEYGTAVVVASGKKKSGS
jgi:holo-[acyl-carrier protein] synthase